MKIVSAEDLEVDSILKYFDDVVVVPTETVYGLAASIYNPYAINRIFELKNRPVDNPLIVHVSSIKMLESIVEGPVPDGYRKVMNRFWPGPVSLLFNAKECVSPVVRGGLDTVVVRMPNNKCLLEIIERLGAPIAAPSANISGSPSPTTVQHVREDFGDKVGLIIDGGPCSVGLESTIASFLHNKLTILRPGGLSIRDLEDTLKSDASIRNKIGEDEKALSPGQKYRHYSPRTPLILFMGSGPNLKSAIYNYIEGNPGISRVGIATHSNLVFEVPNGRSSTFLDMGSSKREICRNLFSCLRELDKTCDVILTVGVDHQDEGFAIMDRLERAAIEIITVQ